MVLGPQKADPCVKPCRLMYCVACVKIGEAVLAVDVFKNPEKNSQVNFGPCAEMKPLIQS